MEYIQVANYKIKTCKRCGQPITFVQNRNGKWFAVDVVYHDILGPVYETRFGNHNNMTPWHKCDVHDIRRIEIDSINSIGFPEEVHTQINTWSETELLGAAVEAMKNNMTFIQYCMLKYPN